MKRLFGWMRVGLRDLRGDMRRFGILIACLALGTGVIAAVGSVGAGFVQAVERDATTMMGGDLEASRPDRSATAEELAFLGTLAKSRKRLIPRPGAPPDKIRYFLICWRWATGIRCVEM